MKQEYRWIVLDHFKRQIFIKQELRRKILISYKKTGTSDNVFRVILNLDRKNLPRFGSSVQQANRCVLTGRKRSVSKVSRLSRFRFQLITYKGKLPAFMRASW